MKPSDGRPKFISLRGARVAPGPEPLSLAVHEKKSGTLGATWCIRANSAEEIDVWDCELRKAGSPSFSDPSAEPGKVKHVAHVVMGDHGYKGLPKEWETMLQASQIDVSSSTPKQVQQIMETHDAVIKGKTPVPSGKAQDEANNLPVDFNFTLRDLVSPSDPTEIYEGLELLDEGSMGKVYVATLINSPKEKVAIKKVKLSPEFLTHMVIEVAMLRSSDSPHIVRYIASYVVDQKLWLVLEFMGRGCLADLLTEPELQMSSSVIAYVAREALHALAYIHNLNRIHRDIKR